MTIFLDFSVVEYAVVIAIVLVIVFIIIAKRYFASTEETAAVNKKFVHEMWGKIEALERYGKDMNFKLAIIESDKLLDYVLQQMGIPGPTMAERLKVASYKYPSLRQVWWAHKVRNCVVHDAQYVLSGGEAKKVILIFKKALKDLKCL